MFLHGRRNHLKGSVSGMTPYAHPHPLYFVQPPSVTPPVSRAPACFLSHVSKSLLHLLLFLDYRAAEFPLGSVSVDIEERLATLEAAGAESTAAVITAKGLGSSSMHSPPDLDPMGSNSLSSEPGYLLSNNTSNAAVPPLSSPFFEGLPVIEFPREDVVLPPHPRLLDRPLRAASATRGSSTTSTIRTSRAMSANHTVAIPQQDIYRVSRCSHAAEDDSDVVGEAEWARRVLMGPEMEAALFPSHPRHSSSHTAHSMSQDSPYVAGRIHHM